MKPMTIHDGVFLVGGSDLSDSRDCLVYLLDLGELVLIDTGSGGGTGAIMNNVRSLGFDPQRISTIILTHCHIDHVGGANELKGHSDAKIIMHELDAAVVERGDATMTAAFWYGLPFAPISIDTKLVKEEERFVFGHDEIVCLHTPGHTPGSISIYLDRGGKRILFGQDIHGPFLTEFGSNLELWQNSMKKLIALDADILCEGHFGVYRTKQRVADFIERYLDEYGENPRR